MASINNDTRKRLNLMNYYYENTMTSDISDVEKQRAFREFLKLLKNAIRKDHTNSALLLRTSNKLKWNDPSMLYTLCNMAGRNWCVQDAQSQMAIAEAKAHQLYRNIDKKFHESGTSSNMTVVSGIDGTYEQIVTDNIEFEVDDDGAMTF